MTPPTDREPTTKARALPPIAIAVAFVDRINHGDLDGLGGLLSDDHRLEVFDEPAVEGRAANTAAWRRYLDAFSRYVIHPLRIADDGEVVAILGSTTGSHLGLPDAEERTRTLIWVAHVHEGAVRRWRLIEDTAANRVRFGLDR